MTPHPVTGIDHLLMLTRDLDAAAAQFRRLGFTLSPKATHSPARGSANHTIMFPQGVRSAYFELLGLVAETPANAGRRAALAAHGPGVHGVCGAIADLDAAAPALAERGVGLHNRGDFGRPVPLETGETAQAEFANAVLDPQDTPFGILFICEHRTPDLIWRDALMDHPNGAEAIAEITAISADPLSAAEGFARMFAQGAVTPCDGGATVATGEGSPPLVLLSQAAFLHRFGGETGTAEPDRLIQATTFAVEDLGRTHRLLDAAGVGAIARDGMILVDPGESGGAQIAFTASNAPSLRAGGSGGVSAAA